MNSESQIAKRLMTRDGHDWFVSAVDPFHDFQRPIEGIPDHVCSKSYVRKFNQSLTISATAEDDNIHIIFNGYHGAGAEYESWGLTADQKFLTGTSVTTYPVEILRNVAGTAPSLYDYVDGGATTSLGHFSTTLSPDVPSRIAAMGIEVADVTPTLYKRGTIYATHSLGEAWNGTAYARLATGVDTYENLGYSRYWQPPTAILSSTVSAQPGAFIGPVAKGIYMPSRMLEPTSPTPCSLAFPSGLSGAHLTKCMVLEQTTAVERVRPIQPSASKAGAWITYAEYDNRVEWSPSGFQPFRIMCEGLAAETVLQVTLKVVVEYFPMANQIENVGLATYSPAYDPAAFEMYHAVLRTLPYAVPVGFNPAGEYWRMIKTAIVTAMPHIPKFLIAGFTAAGRPDLAAAVSSVNTLGKQVAALRLKSQGRVSSKTPRKKGQNARRK